jgi:hypothetical protein
MGVELDGLRSRDGRGGENLWRVGRRALLQFVFKGYKGCGGILVPSPNWYSMSETRGMPSPTL